MHSQNDCVRTKSNLLTEFHNSKLIIKSINNLKAFAAEFWNLFDLITVIGSIVDVIVSELIVSTNLKKFVILK